MPCLGCGDRDRKACGCLPACLGRRRPPQVQGTSSNAQAQQDRRSIEMVQTTSPAASHTETRQPAPLSESTGRQAVSPLTSNTGLHQQAPLRESTGRHAGSPMTSSIRPHEEAPPHEMAGQQTARSVATKGREGSPRAPQGDSGRQQAVYSWPRTTGIGYNPQSGFARQQTILPRRQEGIQQDPRSDQTQHQPAPSAGRGQSATPIGDIERKSAEAGGVQLQPARQEVTNLPVPGTGPVKGGLPALPLTARRMVDFYLVDVGFKAAITIGPRSGPLDLATLGSFVTGVARNYNRQVPSQHPRMEEGLFEFDEGPPCHLWSIETMDPDLVDTSSSRQLVLNSPFFNPAGQLSWQRDIEVTWKFLKSQYKIQGDPECSAVTQIFFDPELTLLQQKRIAQAIIHFQRVIQTFIPDGRRGDPIPYRCASFILEIMRRYSPENRNQYSDAIQELKAAFEESNAVINAIENASGLNEVMFFMWVADEICCPWYWEWITENQNLTTDQPPLISTVADAIWWAQFRLSFILASVQPNSLPRLSKIPRTFEGLREFLSGVRRPLRMPRQRYNSPRVRVERPDQ